MSTNQNISDDQLRQQHQQQALDRKEKVQALATDLQDAKLPPTNDIAAAIDRAVESNSLQAATENMSPAGQKAVEDAKKTLLSGKDVLVEKNEGEQLQKAVYSGTRAMGGVGGHMKDKLSGHDLADKHFEGTKDVASQAGRRIMDLGRLLVTSSEFRGLIQDLQNIARDALSASLAATSPTSPTSGTFNHNWPQSNVYQGNVPQSNVYQGNMPQSNVHQGNVPQGNTYQDNMPQSNVHQSNVPQGNTYQDNTYQGNTYQGNMPQDNTYQGNTYQSNVPQGQHPSDHLSRTAQDNPENLPQTAREQAPELYQRAHQTVQPLVESFSRGEISARDAASNLATRATSTAKDAGRAAKREALSPERRDQLVNRLKNIILEIQSHPQFQNGIDEIIDLLKELGSRSVSATQDVTGVASSGIDQNSRELTEARQATRQLIENFCGGTSLDPLITAIKQLGRDANEDPQLSSYFEELQQFIHRSVREPGYVASDHYTNDADNIFYRGRDVFNDNYREHYDNISDQFRTLYDGAANDSTLQEFSGNFSELMADLFLDDQGRPTVKFDLIRDFARLLPVLAQKLEYLPVPRVEGSNDDVDYSLDNMVLRCTNLVPRRLHLHTDTTINMAPPVAYSDRVQSRKESNELHMTNRVHIALTNIRADARDIAFYYKKKAGMARMSDYGNADISIPDKGISIFLTLVTGDGYNNDIKGGSNKERLFHIERADAEVHDMKISLKGTKHDLLYKVLNPIINRQAKKGVERALSERLRNLLIKIDEQLAVMARQAKETAHNAPDYANRAGQAIRNRVGVDSDTSLRDTAYNAKEQVKDNARDLANTAADKTDKTGQALRNNQGQNISEESSIDTNRAIKGQSFTDSDKSVKGRNYDTTTNQGLAHEQ